MNRQYDIIIVGAGMVGLTLANLLKDSKLSIAMIDTGEPQLIEHLAVDEHDLRVSAITSASQQVFERCGAWNAMHHLRVTPYEDMQVWDATGSGEIHFDAASLGAATLGHIIENRVIVAGLYQALQHRDNIDWFCNSICEQLSHDSRTVTVTLDSMQTLEAKLLVGADGGNSWVRRQYHIETTGWTYAQSGVVCTVKTEHGHHHTAWQRFMPTGPLAFLPLNGDYSSIVWSLTTEEAERIKQLDDDAFLGELNAAIGDTPMGQVTIASKRAAFPLRLSHTHDYTAERMALIGDAAHTIHPLAGQGVNLGIMDADVLSQVILKAVKQRRDVGHSYTLRKFERQRKTENLAVMASMDGFKRLFSNEDPWLTLGRNTGLNLVNNLPMIKNFFARQAMTSPTASDEHTKP